jgi:hypothetical protein
MIMKKVNAVFCGMIFLFISSCSGVRNEFYVALTGDDANPGTASAPFRTLQRAKEAAGEIKRTGSGKIINIWIDEGTYSLSTPFILSAEDSGPDGGYISYCGMPDKKVELSGGIGIKEWKKTADGLWLADLNAQGLKNLKFRELFVDGRRAVRARHPDSGYLRVVQAGADRRTSFRYNKGDFPVPDDPASVELVLLHDWSISRIKVAAIDTLKNIITLTDSAGARNIDFFNIDNWEKNPRYFLENSPGFLNSEMEWFYDETRGLLYLKTGENESPEGKNIIIPVTPDHLMLLEGNEGSRLKGIRFENIIFSYCSWLIPEKGYAGIQACHFDPRGGKAGWNVVPSAVDVQWAENCSFINCSFVHLGGSGLRIGTACKDCLVSECRFADISGNGIMIGEGNDRRAGRDVWWKTVPDQTATGNMIGNSTIMDCGQQFFGAVGIWCGLTAGSSIINNHIYNLPYTGVSSGWLWDPDPTPARENRLEGNHIHNVMQVLSDGGGIYMLGLQPGTVITGNLIHDIPLNAGRAESNGMFLDEGTTGVEISDNIIYNIAKSPLRFHRATTNIVKNNMLVCSGENPPLRYNNTPVENIVLENNRILKEDSPTDRAALEAAVSSWKSRNK